jgi:hypothetical protein
MAKWLTPTWTPVAWLVLVSLPAAALPAPPRYAYFTNQNAVQRVLLGGGDVETLVPEQVWPLAIAIDAEGEDLFPAAWSFGIALEWGEDLPVFLRGDADASGKAEITDAIYTLNALFLGGALPVCPDAADADDDGSLAITDAVYLLNYLFLAGKSPPPPGPDACAADPTGDGLEPCEFQRDRCGGR